MKIVILGPPGTGKGTQAKLIAAKFKLKHISTGEIFRAEYEKKSKIGVEAHSYWGSGNLVPDSVTVDLLKKNLPSDNFILDGFPRNVFQAEELSKTIKLDFIININSDKKIIIKRLIGRARIEGRKDDTPEIIENRFKVYEKETKPVLDYYVNNRFNIVEINGNGKPEEIFKDICGVLKKW